MFSIEIGNGAITTGTLSGVDFSTPTYLQIGIDTLGGSSYVSVGTSQFLSVPTAFYATKADTATYALNSAPATYADTASYVAFPEVAGGMYSVVNNSTNVDVTLTTPFMDELIEFGFNYKVYDAADNVLETSGGFFGTPTANIDFLAHPTASKIVVYFTTVHGYKKVTINV